jgi:uncharacterized SAM-binding protein YcdF (DUF218 family)
LLAEATEILNVLRGVGLVLHAPETKMFIAKLALQTLLMPPMVCFLAVVLGALGYRRAIGKILLWAGCAVFIVFSLPAVGISLLQSLPAGKPIDDAGLAEAQAIVLLSAGIYPNAPEYDGKDTASNSTLVRARYAAKLHRESSLPILALGGRAVPSDLSEASVAASLLRDELGVPVRWVVGEGRDTLESAVAARAVLRPIGIETIALVTSPLHGPRAAAVFEDAGFTVRLAATGFQPMSRIGWRDFLPSAKGFSISNRALNEVLGRLWSAVVPGSKD